MNQFSLYKIWKFDYFDLHILCTLYQMFLLAKNVCIVGRLHVVELWSSSSALRIWVLATPKHRDFLALHVDNMFHVANVRVQSPLDCVLAVTLKRQFITTVVAHTDTTDSDRKHNLLYTFYRWQRILSSSKISSLSLSLSLCLFRR
jgi:hypothetical protein